MISDQIGCKVLDSFADKVVLITGAGSGLGRVLEWLLIDKVLTSKLLAIDAVLPWGTVTLIAAALLAVIVLSGLIPLRQLWRMDLASVTKERAG